MSILKVNTIQDKGGNTIISSDGSGTITPNGFGKIGQVVSTFKDDTFGTSSTSLVDVTGLSVTITPTSTSSKILIMLCGGMAPGTSGHNVMLSLLRGSTEIGQSTGGSTSNSFIFTNQAANSDVATFGSHFLDSPSTTSAITYKVQMASTSGTSYIGRRADTDARRMSSSITAWEILA